MNTVYLQKSMALYALAIFLVVSLMSCQTCETGTVQTKEDTHAIECSKDTAKTITHGVAVGFGELLKNTKDEQERIDIIRAFIKPIRFYPDQSGYFYVYNFECVNIAHATQSDLPGTNLYDHKDVKGKFVIRELSAAAKKGGGFVEFYWVKPGSKEEFKKLGYVEPIPGTDYFIGTGVYLQ